MAGKSIPSQCVRYRASASCRDSAASLSHWKDVVNKCVIATRPRSTHLGVRYESSADSTGSGYQQSEYGGPHGGTDFGCVRDRKKC